MDLMLSGKTAESVEGHVERVAADGDGDEHFEEKNGDPVLVPGFAGDGVNGCCFGAIGVHEDLTGSAVGWDLGGFGD